jgi:hypothetical protein
MTPPPKRKPRASKDAPFVTGSASSERDRARAELLSLLAEAEAEVDVASGDRGSSLAQVLRRLGR